MKRFSCWFAVLLLLPLLAACSQAQPGGTTMVTRYDDQASPVQGIAWSPDGKRIAAALLDGPVAIVDASNGKELARYMGHRQQMGTVAWSPDGKYIASGGMDKQVQVWDAGSERRLYTHHEQNGSIAALAWSPDSSRVASASYDGTVQVFDALTGAHTLVYRGHSGSVTALAWSPDGARIASGGYDDTVQVWSAQTGRTLLVYRGHTTHIASLAWSPDGTRIASGSNYPDTRTMQVWTVGDTGNPGNAPKLLFSYQGVSISIASIAWSPDGKRLLYADGANLDMAEASNCNLIFKYTYSQPDDGQQLPLDMVLWSPTGKSIAFSAVGLIIWQVT